MMHYCQGPPYRESVGLVHELDMQVGVIVKFRADLNDKKVKTICIMYFDLLRGHRVHGLRFI